MKFEVGDEVVMDRSSDFFKDTVMKSTNSESIWWSELESLQPLTIKSVKQVYDCLQHIHLEDTDYMVSNKWLKLASKK